MSGSGDSRANHKYLAYFLTEPSLVEEIIFKTAFLRNQRFRGCKLVAHGPALSGPQRHFIWSSLYFDNFKMSIIDILRIWMFHIKIHIYLKNQKIQRF